MYGFREQRISNAARRGRIDQS